MGASSNTASVIAKSRSHPFVYMASDLAWRAADAVTSGGVTNTLPSYRGAITLARSGTGQVPKAQSANFAGQSSVTFASGLGGYSAALATPAAYTFASVVRVTANSSAAHAFTVNGTLNTGSASGFSSQGYAQKVASAILQASGTAPVKLLLVARFDASGATINANSFTAATTSVAGALLGNTLTIGCLDTGNTFPLKGEWVTSGMWNRTLSNAEVSALLTALGTIYDITVSA